jgi:cellulose synthase (UDP-forming)
MTKYVDRSKEADKYQKAMEKEGNYPYVNVFIPTYNEPIEVLEKTIVGALNMDYPNFDIWILDDGRRDWLKDFCYKLKVNYVTRPDNNNAKAGNMNHGLTKVSGDLVNIFDADFVPHKNFLRRTVGFFRDPTIGIVQTPQHFFNKDLIQQNLGISQEWPDEQRLFFDKIQESKDAWDVAFCCGSCSIIRRDALKSIGDKFPTESITEDLLTTLKLLTVGYKTRYLNEKLSMGLAAEGLEGFFVQRERWCHGNIQIIYLKDGPLSKKFSLFQKIMFFPFYWIIQAPSKIILLLVPILYMWFNLIPLYFTTIDDIIYYALPMLLSYFFTTSWLLPSHYMPILLSVQSIFSTLKLFPVVLSSLIKPFGKPFKVTPKGSNNESLYFDKVSFSILAAFLLATLSGMFINLFPELTQVENKNFFSVTLFWAFLNALVLLIVMLIYFDEPRLRREERFMVNEPGIIFNKIDKSKVIIEDISILGVKIKYENNINVPEFIMVKDIDKPIKIKLIKNNVDKKTATFEFVHTEETRKKSIEKLFSGEYSNNIKQLDKKGVFVNILKKYLTLK